MGEITDEDANMPKSEAAEQENQRSDVEAIREAQKFFQSLGLSVESDGLISQILNQEQIVKLKEWHETTTGDGGIIMPAEQDFYRKTLLAVSLWRQQEGFNTNYLLGKGAGVEVALRGNVANRIKRPVEFSYRSHSDFELYDVDYEVGPIGEDLGGKPVYTKPFHEIFGSQEYFPPTKTKGLKNIPPSLLSETAETVDFGGISVRIPQLELLFLDKYVSQENTPRPEGYDGELLASQYVLDRAKIHQYLDQFVIEPAVSQIQQSTQQEYQGQLDGIKKNIDGIKKEFETAEIDLTPQNLVGEFNGRIQAMLDIFGNESSMSVSSISLKLWEALRPEQIDVDGNIIDQEYLQRLKTKIKQMETSAIERYTNMHQEIDQLFDKIEMQS